MVLAQAEMGAGPDGRDGLFRPKGMPMFLGFQTYRVACLDCGYVGSCLSEDERSALEKRLRAG